MVTAIQGRAGVRAATFAVWAAAAASAAYWGLRLSAPSAGPDLPVAVAQPAAPDTAALARLLGAVPQGPAPVAVSRYALVGVLAGRSSGGAALIAIDGKPPRPYRVGASVGEGDLVLQSVGPRQARLGAPGGSEPALLLEMPLRR